MDKKFTDEQRLELYTDAQTAAIDYVIYHGTTPNSSLMIMLHDMEDFELVSAFIGLIQAAETMEKLLEKRQEKAEFDKAFEIIILNATTVLGVLTHKNSTPYDNESFYDALSYFLYMAESMAEYRRVE